MAGFHYNPETGVVGVCRAESGACPLIDSFGDGAVHSDCRRDVVKYAESVEASKRSVFSSMVKNIKKSNKVTNNNESNIVNGDDSVLHNGKEKLDNVVDMSGSVDNVSSIGTVKDSKGFLDVGSVDDGIPVPKPSNLDFKPLKNNVSVDGLRNFNKSNFSSGSSSRLSSGRRNYNVQNVKNGRKLPFSVLGRVQNDSDLSFDVPTEHLVRDRNSRLGLISDSASVVDSFVVDKKHKNGYEVHTLLDDGSILIHNQRSKKLITVLFARPGQVKRYYSGLGEKAPRFLVDIAFQNYNKGKNLL